MSVDVTCPKCTGKGTITLFTSVSRCDVCDGTGVLDDDVDGVPIPIISGDDTVPIFVSTSDDDGA